MIAMENPPSLSHSFKRMQFETRSLPIRRDRLMSLPQSVDLSLECNCSFNRPTTPQPPILEVRKTGVMRSQSTSAVRPDMTIRNSTLNEVVEKFEEVLRDERKKQRNRFQFPKVSGESSASSSSNMIMKNDHRIQSLLRQTSSPSTFVSPSYNPYHHNHHHLQHPSHHHHHPSPLNNFILTRHNEQQTEDDHDSRLAQDKNLRAFVLMRQNTVPSTGFLEGDKSPDVSDFKQFRESSYIIRRNASWGRSGRRTGGGDTQSSSSSSSGADNHHPHLQGSGGGAFGEDSPSESIGTRSVSDDSAVIGSKELTLESLEGVTLCPSPSPSVRSIGVSANFAPSLRRKTDYQSIIKSFSDSSQVSTQTDRAFNRDIGIQAFPSTFSRGTRADIPATVNIGISCFPDAGFPVATQTPKTVMKDGETQANEKCPTCGVKQMETVAVGDDVIIRTYDVAVGPDDDMHSRSRSGKPPVPQKPNLRMQNGLTPPKNGPVSTSPILLSKIPRLSQSPVREAQDDQYNQSGGEIVIEEGTDEILVYRMPDFHPSGAAGKHRTHLPEMIGEESTQHLQTVCKIIDDSEEESESSGDEEVFIPVKATMRRVRAEPSKEMLCALRILNECLHTPNANQKLQTSKIVQKIEGEWFKMSSSRNSDPYVIEDYLDVFEGHSKHLLNYVVNMTDCNGNTAMHYAISYSNFDAASVLLDSKVCDVNKLNKAGYTSIMLVSLSKITSDTQKAVVRRLFQLGDVNLRAKTNSQTALMLAASHGQFATCKLLIEAGAAVNLQDKDGSTALMCAAEHNHPHIVKLLLSHPDTDPSVTDADGCTALKIAMDSGHKDIGLMIYASLNMLSRGTAPYASLRRSSQPIASGLKRTGSYSGRPNEKTGLHLPPSPPLKPQQKRRSHS